MITYYLNGIYFCQCEEGSPFDQAIHHIQSQETQQYAKKVSQAIYANKPIPVFKRRDTRDILWYVERDI